MKGRRHTSVVAYNGHTAMKTTGRRTVLVPSVAEGRCLPLSPEGRQQRRFVTIHVKSAFLRLNKIDVLGRSRAQKLYFVEKYHFAH